MYQEREFPFAETLQERFEAYHAANPQIYERFKELVFILMRADKRLGAKAIAERMRWDPIESRSTTHHAGSATGDAGSVAGHCPEYKINNNFISRYVRLFEREYPEHKGFFRKRKLQTGIRYYAGRPVVPADNAGGP